MKRTFKLIGLLSFFIVVGLVAMHQQLGVDQPAAVPLSQIVNQVPVTEVNTNSSTNPLYGLYVAGKWNVAIDQFVFDDPSVHGVMARVFWNKIETTQGVYDWQILDDALNKAVASNKKVMIDFAAGRGTPAYLYDKGVPKIELTTGNGSCVANPAPWHPAYVTAFSNFVQAFSAHLHTNPAWYNAVTALSLDPFSDSTAELRIATEYGLTPNLVCGNTATYVNATAAWQAAGYRPSKMFQSWTSIANAYAGAFPDKVLKTPIIPGSAFPGINEEGALGDHKVLSDQLTNSMIDDGIARFGPRFMVQWTALNATNGPNAMVDSAGAKGALKGYQLEQRTYGTPACGTNPASCNQDEFKTVIDRAYGLGAQVLEVFIPDVQSYPQALAAAKPQFDTKFGPTQIQTVTNVPVVNPVRPSEHTPPPAEEETPPPHVVPVKPVTVPPLPPVSPDPVPMQPIVTADTTPPTISITAPTANQEIAKSGTITITTNPADNKAVASVKIYINNQLKCTVTASPYACQWSWALPAWWPGWWSVTYNIKAEAYDTAGNMTTSTPVIIRTH